MSDPITIRHPAGPAGPVVYDSPHSGTVYPEDFDHVIDRQLLRQAEDTHVEALMAHVVETGAPLLEAHFPRAYIDANRGLEEMDPTMVEGSWPHPVAVSDKAGRGMGLVWRQLRGLGALYDRKLTVAEVESRIARCWRPYHDALAGLLDGTHAAHGIVVHVNCHSMPSVGDETTVDGPVARADFVLGDRDGTTCDPALTALMAEVLRGAGHSVAINDPYKGVELVKRYSDPAAGRHSVQLEINRRLYMDEASCARAPGFAATEAVLRRLTAAIDGFARERRR